MQTSFERLHESACRRKSELWSSKVNGSCTMTKWGFFLNLRTRLIWPCRLFYSWNSSFFQKDKKTLDELQSFPEGFQQWERRWKKCVTRQRGYLEADIQSCNFFIRLRISLSFKNTFPSEQIMPVKSILPLPNQYFFVHCFEQVPQHRPVFIFGPFGVTPFRLVQSDPSKPKHFRQGFLRLSIMRESERMCYFWAKVYWEILIKRRY